ncbi:uncharacterized protein LOC107035660 [Diachasma alloeum]|uniref:uncharacterized protein LOC107035660 n=1 Tax=Diachasma alloeum TaxID=454923 RepID=UPI0007382252|nr:uncharacterized protein LOC107035660 [Diachasma alloeum]
MELQWHAFHILLMLFAVKVLSDAVLPPKTSFFGLEGDTNLGHSGYVRISTDETTPVFELSSCQSLDINESTCHFAHNLPKTESNLMVMRAWVAATIRDNILGLLGYLLHQPNDDIFPEDTYSSLRIVYEEVRKNNIRTMDILPRLKGISKASPTGQIIDLLKVLQLVLPPFCRSAIVEIVQAFTKNKIALKSILSPETDDKGVDVFADIGLQIIPFLHSKSTRRTYDRSVHAEMGKEFAVFFSAIQEGAIVLTQPVLAALMLNMRFTELSPEDKEDFRYLTDVLRDSKIPDWSPGTIGAVNVKSPYALVEMMMKAIANRPQLDPTVKDIAERLQNRLRKVSKSHRSRLMDPFFDKSELNIPLLLDALEEEAKIPEVKTFKQMINDRNLSLSYALKGFVRYFYPTPRDLVLGFMRRVQDRVPMNNETSSIVANIVSTFHAPIGNTSSEAGGEHNATKTKRSISQSNHCDLWIPPHLNGNSLGYADRQCIHGKNCFSNLFAKIASSYRSIELKGKILCPEEPPKMSLSAWVESLNTPAINPNITSLLENVSTILTIFVKDNEIRTIIDDIMNQPPSPEAKQPLNHPAHGNHILLKDSIKSEGITDDAANSPQTSIGNKKDLLSRILKGMLSIKKVRARRFVYYEVIRVYCILIHGSVEPMTQSFLDKLRLDDSPLSNITEFFAENVSASLKRIISNLTADESDSSFNLRDYRTNRLYLTDLLKRILLLETVKQDSEVFNEVVQLLRPIQDLRIEFPPLMGMPYIDLVWSFLETPGILQKLGEDFDMGRFWTRGRLLRGILEKSLTTLFVRRNESLSKAIKNQIPRVLCTEAGAEPVREILEGITTDQVNVYKIIQYGLDRQKLTADVQEAYANMWNWYDGSFEPLTHVKLMNISLYNTRSDFLSGFLGKVEEKVEEDFRGMRGDIKLMRSAILKTGTGAEPVDYL